MFGRILVLLDGSELAELALPYAEELARVFNSEVELLYVCEPEESKYRHMHQLYLERLAEEVRNRRPVYSAEGTKVSTSVRVVLLDGEPAAKIIDYAEKNDVDLVVMASHGRSGIMSWAMGSVAVKVVRRINKPVLFIRANAPRLNVNQGELFNKILLPLDGSKNAEAALPYVKEIARELPSEVILFQVLAPGQYVRTTGGLNYVVFPEQFLETMKVEAKEYLEKVSQRLIDTKARVRSEVKIGPTAPEIIRFAEESSVRLVAISTYGYSGAKQWILGGVAYKILQVCPAPVLLVRASGVESS